MKNKNGIKKAIRFFMMCFFFVTVGLGAYAQKTVTGIVKDYGGIPLPGVSVIIKGTTTGVATGIDGEYTLTDVSTGTILQFTFVGFQTQEMAVGNQTRIDVTLVPSSIGLDEVVAIGYGTQKKANLTGAVGLATSERLENRPIVSAGQGLQGVIPNLNITFQNGDPASSANFNVRGFESINGGGPLILVDGVPMDLERINPGDIASVTVLKMLLPVPFMVQGLRLGLSLLKLKKEKPEK